MTSTHAERVAAEVRAEMGRHRVTQAQLGQVLGLHQMSVSRRLAGEVPFDVDELYKVAVFLGCPVSRLIPEVAA